MTLAPPYSHQSSRCGSASQSSTTSSVYTPLHHPWQTRLVELLPGNHDSKLHCNLHNADITFAPGLGIHTFSQQKDYECISYSWGQNGPQTVQIVCNGLPLEINPALAEALQYLRLATEPRWLWCDAICIDQSNSDEKSSQVKQMMLIFGKAKSVVAWLGLPDKDTEVAFRLIEYLSLWNCGPVAEAAVLDNPEFPQAYDAARRLIERQWFRRVWIVQEVFAARYLTLVCGKFELEIKRLKGLASRFPPLNPLDVLADTTNPVENLVRKYQRLKLDTFFKYPEPWMKARVTPADSPRIGLELVRLLSEAQSLAVTDAKDRIFALQGIVGNELQLPDEIFDTDYRKTLGSLYAQVTKYIINQNRTLSVLTALRRPRPDHCRQDLPSWAVDWRSECVVVRDALICADMNDKNGRHRAQIRLQDLNTSTLILDGFEIGRVGPLATKVENCDIIKGLEFYNPAGLWPWIHGGTFVRRIITSNCNTNDCAFSGITVPYNVEEGDRIVCFDGDTTSCIIRKKTFQDQGVQNEYLFLGPAFSWVLELNPSSRILQYKSERHYMNLRHKIIGIFDGIGYRYYAKKYNAFHGIKKGRKEYDDNMLKPPWVSKLEHWQDQPRETFIFTGGQ